MIYISLSDTCEILLDSNILQAYDTMDYLL